MLCGKLASSNYEVVSIKMYECVNPYIYRQKKKKKYLFEEMYVHTYKNTYIYRTDTLPYIFLLCSESILYAARLSIKVCSTKTESFNQHKLI